MCKQFFLFFLFFVCGLLTFHPLVFSQETKENTEKIASGNTTELHQNEPMNAFPVMAAPQETSANTTSETGGSDEEKTLPLGVASPKKETPVKTPVSINADTVEYSTDSKYVTATGNVEVVYQETKLTCQKLTVNTDTKEGMAEGNVRLEDSRGIIEAKRMNYNFEKKKGIMYDVGFRANPYFGKAEKVEKINDIEFIGWNTHMSTCNYDNPHFRLKSHKVDFFRGEKVEINNTTVTAGQEKELPIMFLPYFKRSFKDPQTHVQLTPGKSKDWGYFMLSAWRYNFTQYISGRLYLDYRANLGLAQGFGANYDTRMVGKGDFTFYYSHEHPSNLPAGSPDNFQRYLVRLRHKWDIDKNTNLVAEYYKIVDSKRMLLGSQYNILKDYFPREFEKDALPLSYMLIHHLFSNSSLDVLLQKRTNRWYTELEKLPEVTYTLPTSPIGNSRIYFANNTTLANYNHKNAVPSPSTSDLSMIRLDTYNQFSYPTRVAFLNFSPFVAERITRYDDDVNGASIPPRLIFYAGGDLSTKFYRIFNTKTNFLGLDINGLRHVITPTIKHTFNTKPSIISSKLKQIDSVDSIKQNNSLTFELENKLQTKRGNSTVELLNFRVDNSYTFKSGGNKAGGTLSDFLLYLDVYPYSWVSLHVDSTFARKDHHFSGVNADLNFNLGSERTIGFSQRYLRGNSKELVVSSSWRLNPKWKLALYERYQFGHGLDLSPGLREQQYTVIRDLHCWTAELTLNATKGKGDSLWLVMRLKAFPELQFQLDQSYHKPEPGSQNYSGGS